MGKVRLMPSGTEIEVAQGESVLSALEKRGYALPNNCRAGACGECKCKVLSGEFDQGFGLDMALSQEDRSQGYGLMCMAKLKSEILEIEYGTEDAKPKLFPPKENRSYIVMDKYLVTPTIVKLRLKSIGESMRFWPGQYVTLGNTNKGIPERCYSIAGIPNQEGELTLLITKVKDGKTSLWIHNELKAGEIVRINGPYGTFIGNPSVETPVLCLAAGSGLAPILSLASGALMRGGFRQPATVLFSAKTKADLMEEGWFQYMKTKFRNFKFKYTLTQEENPNGLTGRIPDLLKKEYPDLSTYSVYIAGSTGFVEECSKKVIELGAREDHIHTEKFISQ